MNTLQLAFNYEALPVRTFFDNSEIWFVLKDVCIVLGIKNSRDVWNRLDDDEKSGVDFIDTSSNGITQRRKLQTVNEPGLYDTIIRSNSEKAKPFRRWITHEVLPSIRKQGYYSLLSDEELIEVITEKQRIDGSFLGKIDKTAIKAKLLKESREKAQADSDLLYLCKDKYTCKEYRAKLKEIWKTDMPSYHKALDKFQNWYFKIGYKTMQNE